MSRELTIKTGVVKRLAREVTLYHEEQVAQQAKVDKMEADNADEYELRAQKRVLAESIRMIPDTEGRLEKAVQDLQEALDERSEEASEEVIAAAKAVLASAQPAAA